MKPPMNAHKRHETDSSGLAFSCGCGRGGVVFSNGDKLPCTKAKKKRLFFESAKTAKTVMQRHATAAPQKLVRNVKSSVVKAVNTP